MYIDCYHDVIHIPSSTDMLCIVFSRESDSTTPIVHQGCGYIKTRMWLYSKRCGYIAQMWLYSKRCGYMSVTKTPKQLKINQIHIPNTTLTHGPQNRTICLHQIEQRLVTSKVNKGRLWRENKGNTDLLQTAFQKYSFYL